MSEEIDKINKEIEQWLSKLQDGGEYLIDNIQTDYTRHSYGIQTIKVIKETEKAFQIEKENGAKFWFLKDWHVDILEKIN